MTLTLRSNGQPIEVATGSLYYIGNATILLRLGGFTILTDPNFVRRRTNPALAISDLPPLDFVLLSHMHGDHFDDVAQQQLSKTVPIVTTPHGARKLRTKGFLTPYALETWETFTVSKGDSTLRVTAMPGRHGPGLFRFLLPPVMGSMIELEMNNSQRPYRVYISGDTLVYDDLKEIPKRYPDIDLAVFQLGGTRVFGKTVPAQQGVELMQIIKPHMLIPIHYNDYAAFKSDLDEFMSAVREAGLEDRVHTIRHGDTYLFAKQL